jgi:hypothetical protein
MLLFIAITAGSIIPPWFMGIVGELFGLSFTMLLTVGLLLATGLSAIFITNQR